MGVGVVAVVPLMWPAPWHQSCVKVPRAQCRVSERLQGLASLAQRLRFSKRLPDLVQEGDSF